MTGHVIEKVLVYAADRDRLLVFDEPDFPHILPQVPGGTVEHGESPSAAGCREFEEETGFACPSPPRFLTSVCYRNVRDGISIQHRRHFFHLPLLHTLYPQSWIHSETTPHGGGAPVRFCFFWLTQDEAGQRLGYEHGAALPLLL
ncbi:NUDIX domain-containing protein [Agrobacterium vitis]|uniref:NUDIX hydrolase n=1 Tax=Agrobacterium vitis TaxID=373 RepID=UPI0012E8D666|nr:NUDIX domain-containing protein [Agrobacterium vitis]MVA70459.1 NUDIX domain-containing protein [Agrobacterium vitis]